MPITATQFANRLSACAYGITSGTFDKKTAILFTLKAVWNWVF